MSLDGFIAGPNGEYDWIPIDPAMDFEALYAGYDAILLGRKSLQASAPEPDAEAVFPGKATYVISTTLSPEDYPNFHLISDNVAEQVRALKHEAGANIWLFGGGELFGSLNALGLVDGIDLALIPVLLGTGIPFTPPGDLRTSLRLRNHLVYDSGIAWLEYDIDRND